MKKVFLITLLSVLSLMLKAQTISVDAHTDCWVAVIDENAAKHGKYGWWSVWHIIKREKRYKETPCTFEGLKPGKYTLVVYNPEAVDFDPNSGSELEKSDGVVMEEVVLTHSSALEYDFDEEDFQEWNCLSCPWLYVFDGQQFIKTTEVLKDVVGEENRQITTTAIQPENFRNGTLKIRIQEEKDEITHLHAVTLKVNGVVCPMKIADKTTAQKLTDADKYLELRKGDAVDIEFELPKNMTNIENVILETEGFYEPEPEFLKQIKQKYLRKK